MTLRTAPTSMPDTTAGHRSPRSVRLDPWALPATFRYDTGVDPRDGRPMGEAAVILEPTMAQVCRRLPSGIPMAMRLPMAAFEGVAIRFAVDPQTEADVAVVELLHRDPYLSVPLAVAADVVDVAADWRAWAEVLALPRLVVEDDGTWHSFETRLGDLVVAPVKPRRRRSVLAGRRPRFLQRRIPGHLAVDAPVLEKNELFGRE